MSEESRPFEGRDERVVSTVKGWKRVPRTCGTQSEVLELRWRARDRNHLA